MFISKTRRWKNDLLTAIPVGIGLVIVPFLPWVTETNGWTGTNSYSLADASFPQAFILMLAGGAVLGLALALLGDNSKARLPIYYGGLISAGVIVIAVTVASVVSPPSIGLGLLQNESTPLLEGFTAQMCTFGLGCGVLGFGVETFFQGRRDMRSLVDLDANGDTVRAGVRSEG